MKAGIILVALLAAPAAADVYRCDAPGGGVTFSDSPCSTESERVDVQPSSGAGGAAPTGRSPQEQLRERTNAREARQTRDSKERVRAAGDRVRQMRIENHDPAKCQAAKQRAAMVKQRDPLTYSISMEHIEMTQKMSLYCGPDQ